MTADRYKASFYGDKNVLELVVMIAQVQKYTKTH